MTLSENDAAVLLEKTRELIRLAAEASDASPGSVRFYTMSSSDTESSTDSESELSSDSKNGTHDIIVASFSKIDEEPHELPFPRGANEDVRIDGFEISIEALETAIVESMIFSPEDSSEFVRLFQSELQSQRRFRGRFKIPEDSNDLLCPIGRFMMTDPVATADGSTYERSNIEQWLVTKGKNTDPLTNLVLADKTLTPNPHFAAALSTLDAISLQRYFPKSAAFLNQRGTLKITKVNDSEVVHFGYFQSELNVFDLIQKIQDCDVPATIQGLQKTKQNAFTNMEIF